MSIDPKRGRYCDGCGELIKNAHKLHLKKEYCGSCYKGLFKPAECIICSGKVIAHKNELEPVCSACTNATRTCLRCGKAVPRAGLMIDDRAVCPSCVPYFKEAQKCARCERVTARLSTMPSAGVFEKICDSCRNKHTHATCSVCRKYRKVGGRKEDASPICVDCVGNVDITHACPGCGQDVPGKGESQCRSCLNSVAIDREIKLTTIVFANDWVALLWARFAMWMHGRTPSSPKVLQVIRTHQPFFERIDAAFDSALELTGPGLLQLFGTATLRKHVLPVQFLAEQLDVHVPSSAKSEASDLDRMNEILISAKRQPWNDVLQAYHQILQNSTLTLLSQRKYLAGAAHFCASADVGDEAWPEGALERYLDNKPGARNDLSRFVTFCKSSRGWDVCMPAKGMVIRPLADPVRSAQKLGNLLREAEAAGLENASKKTLGAILALSLGISKAALLSSTASDFELSPEAVIYKHGKERIRMPEG